MRSVSPPSESPILRRLEADIGSSESPYYHLGHYYDTLSATPAQMYVVSYVQVDKSADEKGNIRLSHSSELLVGIETWRQVYLQDYA